MTAGAEGGFAPSMSMNLDLNQLLPTTVDVNGEGTSTTKSSSNQNTSLVFDPATKAFLDNILSSQQYSKAAAVEDSKGAADWAIKQTLQAGAPAISSASKSAGGYNNTTTDMLNNDLTAKASAAGQSVLLDTITKYAMAQANTVQAAGNAVTATTGRSVSTDASQDTATTSHQNTSNDGQLAGTVKKFVPAVGGGGTVICTTLYLDGHIPVEVYNADRRYVAKHFSEATQNGYRFWAVPFVGLMRRNRFIYAVGKYIGVRWSYYCASKVMRGVRSNLVGALATAILVPICWLLGKIVAQVEYMHIWEGK